MTKEHSLPYLQQFELSFLSLYWLPPSLREPSLPCYLIHNWSKMDSCLLAMCINAKWTKPDLIRIWTQYTNSTFHAEQLYYSYPTQNTFKSIIFIGRSLNAWKYKALSSFLPETNYKLGIRWIFFFTIFLGFQK